MIWVPPANAKKDQIRHVFNQIKIRKVVQNAMRKKDFLI